MQAKDHPPRWRRFFALIVVAAFGPYLVAGIRTEQVAIYGATLLALLSTLGQWRRFDPGMVGLIWVWSFIVAISTISGWRPPPEANPGSFFSGLDALLAPLCLMAIVTTWAGSRDEARSALVTVQKATVIMLTVNTGVAFAMSVADLVPFLTEHFWSGTTSERATGALASQLGRYSGVFNTPLAAGIGYSVGLIALVHLHASRQWHGMRVAALALALIVGGVLPQTKVFLFVGLPVAAVLLFVVSGRRRASTVIGSTVVVGGGLLVFAQTRWWADYGGASIARYFNVESGSAVDVFTAGRYVEGSSVKGITATVLETAPWTGYGASVNLGPLDTWQAEMLARAGILGLSASLVWVAVLVYLWASRRRHVDATSWWCTGGMLVVLIGASLGGPSITQNRAGTLLLCNLLLMLTVARPAREPREARRSPGARPATGR